MSVYVRDGLGLNRGRRVLHVALLLLAGALGKTAFDVIVAPRPASAAAVVVPALPSQPELAPLPRPPAPKKSRNKSARSAPRPPKPVAPPVDSEEDSVPPPMLAPPLVATEPPAPPPVAEAAAVAPAPVEEEPLSFDGNGAEIARAIARAKRAAVQACFEHELKRSPTLAGNVTVELDLAPPKTVQAVRVTDDLGRPEFTQCVTAAMQHLAFTGLNEEVSVQLPYVLSARRK